MAVRETVRIARRAPSSCPLTLLPRRDDIGETATPNGMLDPASYRIRRDTPSLCSDKQSIILQTSTPPLLNILLTSPLWSSSLLESLNNPDIELKMSCMNVAFMALFLALSSDADSTAVSGSTGSGKRASGRLKRIFMKEPDASNFSRRRSRRGVKSQDDINAEQRQILAADEQKMEFHEEKRNELESYVEEDNDEQYGRTRERTEQWREFHHDGMYPPPRSNRPSLHLRPRSMF
ncbi:LOW QUALITY PROTEIN: unique cartilage matrix-associated protein [Brachionichthys hirsutus]|uniref:LOW QUALITY PROTEIN: unique cartilage matrix-associated protein n=1 Tax=Brachionichthys hirsutus TaxID=412623 RepID=UPI0036045616